MRRDATWRWYNAKYNVNIPMFITKLKTITENVISILIKKKPFNSCQSNLKTGFHHGEQHATYRYYVNNLSYHKWELYQALKDIIRFLCLHFVIHSALDVLLEHCNLVNKNFSLSIVGIIAVKIRNEKLIDLAVFMIM